ncbi:hypothetical protein BJ170DRAFT_595267 [Xylariales sp. AK1849]|nr:hypothetical protein BJ170DRAFT_595267 [Xylariales sp. AK1849]
MEEAGLAGKPESHMPSSRLFQCRICAHSFLKNEHLVRHIRSHTKEKPFKCPDCGNRYSRRDTLIRHRRDVKCNLGGVANNAAVTPFELPPGELESDWGEPRSLASLPEETWWAGDSSRAAEAPLLSIPPQPSSANWSNQSDQSAPTSHPVVSSRGSVQPMSGNTDLLHVEQCLLIQDSPIQPDLYDLRECFSSWDIAPHLHQDILQMDISPLESVWNAEVHSDSVSTLDMQLADLRHIQHMWHSQIPETPGKDLYYPGQTIEPIYGPLTPPCSSPSSSSDVDDQYRQGLRNSFRISLYEPTIPSVDFLNVCVRLYFAKVHPLFPILHAPTFRPCKSNAGLLLSVCAMGCLFTGSDRGFQHGVQLFERTHKTTLLKWERLSARNRDVMIPMIQSALISQLFGMLSGSQVLLLTVDAFHGPPIAWARQLRLHQTRDPLLTELDLQGLQLDHMWRKWAHHEELLRIAHGLYIIDAELSNLLHREPYQSFESYSFAHTASEATFMAGNADEWKLRILSDMQCREKRAAVLTRPDELSKGCFGLARVPTSSPFTANAFLQGIGMRASLEWAKPTPNLVYLQEVSKSLAVFHHRFLDGKTCSHHESLHLTVIWHAVHMSVLVNFDLLEKAVGREGRRLTQSEEEALKKWFEANESRVCIKHALMIQRHMDSYPIASEPAMHIPRALFWAGIVVFCHIRWGTYDKSTLLTPSAAFGVRGTGESKHYKLGLSELDEIVIDNSLLKTMLFMLTDMLRSIRHWGLAQRFAQILTNLNNIKY